MWCQLGDVTTYSQTKVKINGKDICSNIWSLDLEDIEKDTGKILNKVQSSERKIKGDKTKFFKGDITLYAKWTEDGYSSDKTDEEISNNSKTGDVMMFIVWTVGIGTLAYSVYYFKTRKEN